jgi:hypothetical protein
LFKGTPGLSPTPPIGVWHEKEKGGSALGQLGPAYTRGRKRPTAWDGSRAERKRKGRGKRNGPGGEKERERRGRRFSLFFLFNFFSNSFFKLSNFNQIEIHAFET